METRIPILAYHAIVEDGQAALPQSWSRPHAVSLAAFRAQMDVLASGGWHTVLPQALDQTPPPKSVVITFDDGHSSDLLAARELHQRRLQAAFFVTCSNIGSDGYLDSGAVLELTRQGFEIGSHGVNHVRFANLAPDELQFQLAQSRQRLEELIRQPVTAVAFPFGSYDGRVIAGAIGAGYRTVMTSDFGLAVAGRYVLSRLGVHSRTTIEEFKSLLSGNPISIARMRLANGIRRRLTRLFSTRE